MQEPKEQIGQNSQKSVRISYEFHANFKSPKYSHKFIHVKFVRFAKKQSKHASQHTLHSLGHVMLHAPVFAHLGDRHAEAVLARCYSVVGRSGGAMPVMAKWISDSASALSPCTPPAGARCQRRTTCTARRPR